MRGSSGQQWGCWHELGGKLLPWDKTWVLLMPAALRRGVGGQQIQSATQQAVQCRVGQQQGFCGLQAGLRSCCHHIWPSPVKPGCEAHAWCPACLEASGWLATLRLVMCQVICLTGGSPEDVATARDGPAALQVVQADGAAITVLLVAVSTGGGHRSGRGTCTVKQAARSSAPGKSLTCSSCGDHDSSR